MPKSFRDNVVTRKGQGPRRKIVEKSWLKQLKVAISTGASLPERSSPKNSKTNFVDLRDVGSKFFQKLANIPPKGVLDRNTRTASFLSMPSKFSCKMARWGRVTFFKEKMHSLPYSHKNFRIVPR
jgi:hypothetical protein